MRMHGFIAPALMAVGLVAADGAAAADLVQLNGFSVVTQMTNQFVVTLEIDAPPAAAGQPVTIFANNLPVMPWVLMAGPNFVSVPQTYAKSYTVSGPMIAAKTILVMGSN